MQHMSQFLRDLAAKSAFPAEAVSEIARIEERLDNEARLGKSFDAVTHAYGIAETLPMAAALENIAALAGEYRIQPETAQLVFLLNCTENLYEKYRAAGIDEAVFWDTMVDFRCKINECMDLRGVVGTFVPAWFDGFFKMKRFALGRFQFEIRENRLEQDFTLSTGRIVHPNEAFINMHIPSTGISLTDAVRLDSYRRGYAFFRNRFAEKEILFGCHSWLLYPEMEKFLPEQSNILKFQHDFEIASWVQVDTFTDLWRIFGKASLLPFDQLPRDNSLWRGWADWLSSGKKGGKARGFFLFDGEKIVRGDKA